MFDRRLIKKEAKEILRKYYWLLFIACLVLFLIEGNDFGIKINFKDNIMNVMHDNSWRNDVEVQLGFLSYKLSLSYILNFLGYILVSVIAILSVFFVTFIGNPLIVGCRNYIAHTCDDKQSFNDIVTPFHNYYWNAVGTMFLRNLFIFLWSLLLVIPGIIKAYSYQFVPYLLEDEPNLVYGDILKKSAEMTRGLKMDLFILDLSFFGWYLLNIPTMGLAKYFISPYVQTSKALVYQEIKREVYHG